MAEIDIGKISFEGLDVLGDGQQSTWTDIPGRTIRTGTDGINYIIHDDRERMPKIRRRRATKRRSASRPRPQLAHR